MTWQEAWEQIVRESIPQFLENVKLMREIHERFEIVEEEK